MQVSLSVGNSNGVDTDWIQDLKFAKTTPLNGCDGCEVELGFNENYNALRPQVRQLAYVSFLFSEEWSACTIASAADWTCVLALFP